MRGRGGTGRRWRLKIFCPWRAGSSPAVRTSIALVLAGAATAGCDRRSDTGTIVVSAIGGPPRLSDARAGPRAAGDRLLADSVAQGLVRFDAAGQIEPGVAERWIVVDDGMTYIFRLRAARWADGTPVSAADVVAVLKRQLASGSRNPLAPFLTAIDDVVEMTPHVIQIELSRPRPDLLKLFAQPELAIMRRRPPGGTGPFRAAAPSSLVPMRDVARASDEQEDTRRPDSVRLIGERAARAVVRFAARRSDLVAGGTFADWPIAARAALPPATVRLDPAAGLFGLAVIRREGFMAGAGNRAALAAAIDRTALVAAFARDWAPTEQLLPEQLDSADAPALSGWIALDRDNRRAAARAQVDAWIAATRRTPTLRIALPAGPGATLLWGRLAADFLAVGVRPLRVAMGDTADLSLVDAVAPYDSARWYVALACRTCDDTSRAAIERARVADTPAARAVAIAEADRALMLDQAFIPLARPLRWSLVARRLRQWQPNARAWHPLNRLLAEPR